MRPVPRSDLTRQRFADGVLIPIDIIHLPELFMTHGVNTFQGEVDVDTIECIEIDKYGVVVHGRNSICSYETGSAVLVGRR